MRLMTIGADQHQHTESNGTAMFRLQWINQTDDIQLCCFAGMLKLTEFLGRHFINHAGWTFDPNSSGFRRQTPALIAQLNSLQPFLIRRFPA